MDHSLLIAGEGIGGLWGGRSEEMWGGGEDRNATKILQTPPPPPHLPTQKKMASSQSEIEREESNCYADGTKTQRCHVGTNQKPYDDPAKKNNAQVDEHDRPTLKQGR